MAHAMEQAPDDRQAPQTFNTLAAIELAGNLPAKMLTLMAQITLGGHREFSTYSQLSRRLDKLQGDEPVLEFKGSAHVEGYLHRSLVKAGLMEHGLQIGTGGRRVKAARATLHGENEGTAIAGALCNLELETPHNDFLLKVAGLPSQMPGIHNHRAMLYQKLLEGPRALSELTSDSYRLPAVTRTVKELCTLGILEEFDHGALSVRQYTVSEPKRLGLLAPETRAAVAGALALHRSGQHTVSGADILDRACEVHPHLSPRAIQFKFLRWMAANKPSFIRELNPPVGKQSRLSFTITEAYRHYIAEWLHIRELLNADTEAGQDFREEATRKALELIDDPDAIRQLLSPGNVSLQTGGRRWNWQAEVPVLIPDGGISMKSLYRRFLERTGKYISYGRFSVGLQSMDSIIIESRPQTDPGRRNWPERYVVKPNGFVSGWGDLGRCNTEDIDIELFFPPTLQGKSIEQAEKAKTICWYCPVRLPCLKDAVDKGVEFGIRGGVWLEHPGENTQELRKSVASLPVISRA